MKHIFNVFPALHREYRLLSENNFKTYIRKKYISIISADEAYFNIFPALRYRKQVA